MDWSFSMGINRDCKKATIGILLFTIFSFCYKLPCLLLHSGASCRQHVFSRPHCGHEQPVYTPSSRLRWSWSISHPTLEAWGIPNRSIAKRTYALRSGDTNINSQDDVKEAIKSAQKASSETRSLLSTAQSRLESSKSDLSTLPNKPYENLAAFTKHLVQVANGAEKPNFSALAQNTADAFSSALATTGRLIDTLGKMQASLTNQGASLSSHNKRLESAKRFLATEKSNQERRRNDATNQRDSAQSRINQTTDKINELRRKIDNPWSDWKYKQAMEWVGAGIRDPRFREIYGSDHQAQALLKAWTDEWKSNEVQKKVYERDRSNAQGNYDDAAQRMREADEQIREVNRFATQIAQEVSRTDAVRIDLDNTTSALVRARSSLSQIHPALADMTAIARESFKPRYHRTFARSVMRVLLATPNLPAFNRGLGPVAELLKQLPAKVLDGEADPDDYGTPEPPLRGLFQEVQNRLRLK
ncbi:uncharacterized protein ACLA_062770 [Aspergillus clavatus NRRL 1]|uniref:Uncharacterized protein n=1 Tax=Aspergillus clavatus (strain ATCC 1007 / CBS 513.65 / DSM 816 / NCTC 3887 / NRRL 1 / QM 1276 / 107) TaxID=344612 RepID=A1CCQ5_ASPCL|nr:uncharacterized protein ACLA_062770 [Aspergillus clavatus NRRL 1]EAW12312.1 hypothetical protein ACLA_062770 [Aspergillus clavatus NRRL 1]